MAITVDATQGNGPSCNPRQNGKCHARIPFATVKTTVILRGCTLALVLDYHPKRATSMALRGSLSSRVVFAQWERARINILRAQRAVSVSLSVSCLLSVCSSLPPFSVTDANSWPPNARLTAQLWQL